MPRGPTQGRRIAFRIGTAGYGFKFQCEIPKYFHCRHCAIFLVWVPYLPGVSDHLQTIIGTARQLLVRPDNYWYGQTSIGTARPDLAVPDAAPLVIVRIVHFYNVEGA